MPIVFPRTSGLRIWVGAAQLAFNLSWAVNILLFAVKMWAYAVSGSKAVLVRRSPPDAPAKYASIAMGDRKGV